MFLSCALHSPLDPSLLLNGAEQWGADTKLPDWLNWLNHTGIA